MRRTILALSISAVLAFGACGDGDTDAPPADNDGVTVTASDFAFSPTSLEAEPGTSLEVTLVNEDEATHSLTFEDPAFDIETAIGEISGSLELPDGDATYPFFCKYHPDTMRGELVAGAGGTGTGGDDETEEPVDDGGGIDY
jgi:plastocyanin